MGYESDVTDSQWELIKDFFDFKKGKHLQIHDKRTLVNAVLDLLQNQKYDIMLK